LITRQLDKRIATNINSEPAKKKRKFVSESSRFLPQNIENNAEIEAKKKTEKISSIRRRVQKSIMAVLTDTTSKGNK